MIRIIAVILCLLSTLYLIPIQGECTEITEYEPDTEAEYSSFITTKSVSVPAYETGQGTELPYVRQRHFPPAPEPCAIPAEPQTRIMHCVFRE